MAKIKKTSSTRTKTSVAAPVSITSDILCSHNASLGHCWMCWLFKSLTVLFCAFLLIWIGFCCGLLKNSRHNTYYNEALKNANQNRFCSAGTISHTMSANSMGDMMGDPMLLALKDKTGEEFDREFLIQMIIHHEGGIEMAKMALEKSTNEEIRTLAQSIIDSQSAEIEQMTSWVE